jgi:hypothetical protein
MLAGFSARTRLAGLRVLGLPAVGCVQGCRSGSVKDPGRPLLFALPAPFDQPLDATPQRLEQRGHGQRGGGHARAESPVAGSSSRPAMNTPRLAFPWTGLAHRPSWCRRRHAPATVVLTGHALHTPWHGPRWGRSRAVNGRNASDNHGSAGHHLSSSAVLSGRAPQATVSRRFALHGTGHRQLPRADHHRSTRPPAGSRVLGGGGRR